MSMYALQVMTGMEAEITQKLRGKGVDARCPQERRMIRRGGKWQEQLYTLFPSYIFVSTPDVYRVYYAVRDEDGVLHWLGATKGAPEALSAREEANTSSGWPEMPHCRPARRRCMRTALWILPAGRWRT